MIETYRNQVDAIDAGIVALLEERMDCSLKIGEYKEKHQMAVEDQGREVLLLKGLRLKTKNEAYWEAIEVIYQEIFKVSKVAQTVIRLKEENAFSVAQMAQPCPQPNVAYFGQQGSYTHEAMKLYFPNVENQQSYLSFETVVEAVVYGECRYGILPIENSSTGSIHAVYDLLGKEPIQIIGEVCCPIEHYLMAAKGVEKEKLKTVYSHPQALSQCERYLLKEGFASKPVDSSSKGAALVSASGGDYGAIASLAAAKQYDLEILEGPIGDYEMNRTRFIVFEAIRHNLSENKGALAKLPANIKNIANATNTPAKATVIGISFQIPNQCGQLFQILNIFYETELNLLKIESRPIGERPFEYQFYIDFEGQLSTEGVQSAIHRLEAKTTWLKVLGTWEKTI